MAARHREDPAVLHRNAQIQILSSLAAGEDDGFELMRAIAPFDIRHHFTPDVALLEVAATALSLACAACLRGGLLPDLLREAGIWEPRLWTYAISAVVLYARAAADRLGQTVPDVATKIAEERGLDIPANSQSTD